MNKNELTITTERIDDIVLLIEVMKQMGLPEIVDQQLGRHWAQQGLSWGWTVAIWLAHVVSQGDHRKVTVREWVRQAQTTLVQVTGQSIRETDFTDDRLGLVLKHLSDNGKWERLEETLGQRLVRVYQLKARTVRVDATTVSGYHEGGEDSLWQYGHSKDDPSLKQVKAMMATLDPMGMPLAVDVVSGECADDPLYVPIIKRVLACLGEIGLLFVGDSKMSALATRAYVQNRKQTYLVPLAMVGDTAGDLSKWLAVAPSKLTAVYDTTGSLIATGYELSRQCSAEVDEQPIRWTERVLVVHSEAHAETLHRQLDERLKAAQTALFDLTPARGRGKRQFTDQTELIAAASAILKRHHVNGLLDFTFEQQIEISSHAVGRGRGAANRPQQVVERVRFQMTTVTPNEPALTKHRQALGWRPFVTTAPLDYLSFVDAVLLYRQEFSIERGFSRLKGAPLSIAPVFVKRDDQILGLTRLLSLALRLLTLIEFVVRRALHDSQQQLLGLHLENPRKATATPTTERLLRAFDNITLTIIHLPDRLMAHLPPLTPLQTGILALLGLSPDVYLSLARQIPFSAFLSNES